MLFWIFVIIIVVALILFHFDYEILPAILLVIGIGCSLVSIVVIGVNQIPRDGYVAAMEQRYNILNYQLKNDLYDNDNDLGKKELYDQVLCWNEGLASRKKMQRDFWVGIYIPNVYDQFEFIDYAQVK